MHYGQLYLHLQDMKDTKEHSVNPATFSLIKKSRENTVRIF